MTGVWTEDSGVFDLRRNRVGTDDVDEDREFPLSRLG